MTEDMSRIRREWYDESPEPDAPIIRVDFGAFPEQFVKSIAKVGTSLHQMSEVMNKNMDSWNRPQATSVKITGESPQDRALRIRQQGHSMASKNAMKLDWRHGK